MCRWRGQPSQGQLDRSVPVQVDVSLEEREQTLSRDEIPAAGCVEHCRRLEHLPAEPQQGQRASPAATCARTPRPGRSTNC
jgi:hypothetical protein